MLKQKSNKRLMVGTIIRETKRGRPKKGLKTYNPQEPKKGKELVPLMVGSYLTNGPYNVACMIIVKCNNNGRSITSITHQCNLPLYSKG
jgi:hypothetical protein